MKDYEKLGAFYLGRRYDPDTGKTTDENILYDAKDLTTHAVCVGMTGSGKTGLCVSLIEEAAIDGVPAIVIDPKGDLGNLLLGFPELRAEDFLPWIDPAEAARQGRTPQEHARATSNLWRRGLEKWDESGERIARLHAAADFAIYTPGGSAGLPITVLRSFDPPPPEVAADAEASRDRVISAVSGLLALAGVDADPLRSREHILLSALLDRAWSAGRSLDLAGLIHAIQSPPFEKLGVLDIESFFPANERFALAMTLNNLLASPAFAAWSEGEPLDISRLLYSEDGRPRVSILSIAHLSDSERMFFVTILLNEVVTWMRGQPGTSSLRALLYMDEVFGFFPPTANPPSKRPMLTLLKQARAHGLGVVLATQNPVDLDYKGLSNAGTWFLGRLQTERDKLRVIDGLEGASTSAGHKFDRARIESILSGLSSRVFLMNNVHDDEPQLFHTRWALSYLRGPLTREQIARLMADRKDQPARVGATPSAPAQVVVETAPELEKSARPVVPPKIDERFVSSLGRSEGDLLYRPALLATATLHYARARGDIDVWKSVALVAPISDADSLRKPWEVADVFSAEPDCGEEPESNARFADLPIGATRTTSYTKWSKMLKTHLYRTQPLSLLRCKAPKATSRPGQSEGEFRAQLRQLVHEKRDLTLEKLRKRYGPKVARLSDRIRRAEQRTEREKSQYSQQKMQTVVSLGATLVGALFGRKLASARSVGRATTAVRGMGRAARERDDIGRAEANVEALRQQLADLEVEVAEQLEEIRAGADDADYECTEDVIRARKADLAIEQLVLAWLPWRVDAQGVATPDYEIGA